MKIKRKYIFVVVMLFLITMYVIYGYYIGFNCKFILTNNLSTILYPDFYPANPDLTVRVNYDEVLTQLNVPSDRLYEEVIINKRFRIGYYWIGAESDSMGVFGENGYLVLYPRKITIGLYGSGSKHHMMISVD